ncbi:MAG: M28 family metallopeptidase [Xanthomonadales bacterium]|nr:M28 family metallopeptidase [Xanthomonadales bacterium]
MHRGLLLRNRRAAWIGIGLAMLVGACSDDREAVQHAFAPAITAEDLAARTGILASDEFGGRPPSGPFADRTVAYLIGTFERMGLSPGFGDDYLQRVPLISIEARPDAVLQVSGKSLARNYAYGSEMMVWTTRVVERAAIESSDMVFVGYGIVAPEYGWNDYAGLDMQGKTALILINDPGFATQDSELFTGNAMTYYGRWTYKFEEAARQGADGALVIHETAPASYPWSVVETSWTGPQFDMVRPGGNASRVAIEGWVQRSVAEQLFADSGLDFEALKAAATQPDFTPVPLDSTASVAVDNTLARSETLNVGAVLRGAERPEEAVLFSAHWDHLGQGPEMDGDSIYNGAADNAAGVAMILEVAEKMAGADAVPRRSVMFLLFGAEEQGLLGAYHFAANPAFALAKTVAMINTDVVLPLGEMADITVVGRGSSQLEEILQDAVSQQGRRITPYPNPEQGFYFRSDHFALAKQGVPALYLDTGTEHISRGTDFVTEAKADYIANRYHTPNDEVMETWDWSGVALDTEAMYSVGWKLAQGTQWPRWYASSPFRAVREKTSGERR